ncbi:hypothetical protein [Streptomyces sp. NPDC051642]|uniref:hypothetical protein n=1 Tax=unclassified Streptomyces TaxID=2593676 RepID=UPI00343E6599
MSGTAEDLVVLAVADEWAPPPACAPLLIGPHPASNPAVIPATTHLRPTPVPLN